MSEIITSTWSLWGGRGCRRMQRDIEEAAAAIQAPQELKQAVVRMLHTHVHVTATATPTAAAVATAAGAGMRAAAVSSPPAAAAASASCISSGGGSGVLVGETSAVVQR